MNSNPTTNKDDSVTIPNSAEQKLVSSPKTPIAAKKKSSSPTLSLSPISTPSGSEQDLDSLSASPIPALDDKNADSNNKTLFRAGKKGPQSNASQTYTPYQKIFDQQLTTPKESHPKSSFGVYKTSRTSRNLFSSEPPVSSPSSPASPIQPCQCGPCLERSSESSHTRNNPRKKEQKKARFLKRENSYHDRYTSLLEQHLSLMQKNIEQDNVIRHLMGQISLLENELKATEDQPQSQKTNALRINQPVHFNKETQSKMLFFSLTQASNKSRSIQSEPITPSLPSTTSEEIVRPLVQYAY